MGGKKDMRPEQQILEQKQVCTKIRLTLHAGEKFFGPGICELLEEIRDTGSIQAAAAKMEMSYTKAWKILNRAEKEMGTSLVIRVNGGKNGGSSRLTESGEKAVCAYREMEAKLCMAGSELLKEYMQVFTAEQSEPYTHDPE